VTSDVDFGSYGLDQCMDLVERALKSRARRRKPEARNSARDRNRSPRAMLECGWRPAPARLLELLDARRGPCLVKPVTAEIDVRGSPQIDPIQSSERIMFGGGSRMIDSELFCQIVEWRTRRRRCLRGP